MTASYRVKAPFVNLRVRDHNGRVAVNGFYAGAVVSVSDAVIEEESLRRHIDRGWLEPLELLEQEPETNPDEPSDEVPGDDPAARPSQNDTKADWVDFAVAQGVDRAEAEALTKAELINLLK